MTAAKPDTWMPMFWGDYARDTAHLNDALHGAYLMLIKHCWCSGKPLPDDDVVLWRIACCDSIAAWKKKRPIIAPFFDIRDGYWHHKRVDLELARAIANVEKRARAGQKGAETRWQTDGTTNGSANAVASDNRNDNAIANASETLWQNDGTSTPPPSEDKILLEFEQWYAVYPLHKGRGQALKAYRLARKKATPDQLLAGAKRYREDPKRNPDFTKHPATWLHGECWKDESAAAQARQSRSLAVGTPEWEQSMKDMGIPT